MSEDSHVIWKGGRYRIVLGDFSGHPEGEKSLHVKAQENLDDPHGEQWVAVASLAAKDTVHDVACAAARAMQLVMMRVMRNVEISLSADRYIRESLLPRGFVLRHEVEPEKTEEEVDGDCSYCKHDD